MRRQEAIARVAVVSIVSVVSIVAGVSVFAQSDTRPTLDASASTLIALHGHTPVLRVYVNDPLLAASSVTVPSNLTFPDYLRPIIDRMLERSSTFRRQALRISQTPALLVSVRTWHPNLAGGPRARTEIMTTKDGRIIATVSIKPHENLSELIAHELEHVVEQLDGVDLRARSALTGTGVWSCADGSFETTRAVRTGLAVARETNPAR